MCQLKNRYLPLKHLKVGMCVYFITTCTFRRKKIFSNPEYARVVVDAIIYGRKRGWYKLLGFVVMPDHIHLCVVPDRRNVPSIMQGIKGFTSRKINITRTIKEKLWQKGYRDFAMDSSKAIYQKLRYIEENPVRAGLVEGSVDYPFSSAGKYDELDLSNLLIGGA